MNTMKIDKTDLKILDTLQREARITNQDLAERVCLSPSSCLQRVRRLENENIIRSYHASINLPVIARHVTCIATVSLKNHTQEEFKAFELLIDSVPEIVECDTVSGESDFILRIVCADMNRYLEINDHLVSSTNYLVNINTYVVMKKNKQFKAIEINTLLDTF